MTASIDHALHTYYEIVFYTGVFLSIGYLIVLYRIWAGSKYDFLYLITIMLLFCNIFGILSDAFMKPWFFDPSKKKPYLALQSTAGFLRDALFNLAHWIFSFKYWTIAVEMDFLLALQEMSPKRKSLHQCLNNTFMTLDVLMPLLYSVSYTLLNMNYNTNGEYPTNPPNSLLALYLVSCYSRGILLLISAFFLADSISRIKKAIQRVDATQKLNQKNFIAHLLVLGLFILSTFVFYVAFTFGYANPKNQKASLIVYRTWDTCVLMNFL